MSKKYFVKMIQHFQGTEKTAYFGPYEAKAQAQTDIEKEAKQAYHLSHGECARPSLSIVRLATHTSTGKRWVVAPSLFASR